MRILILRSNPIAPDPRVEKIARTLTTSGHSVTCLGWDRSAHLPSTEEADGYSIQRLAIAAQYGRGMQNLPALLRWQWHLLSWLVRYRQEYDVLHACDFDTVLPALLIKAMWNKWLVYDIFDFYADHLRRTPGFFKNMIKQMDFWAMGKADGVILVDDARTEQIQGSHPKLITVIYNSPEDEYGNHPEWVLTYPEYKLRITYVGLLQVERGLLEIIEILCSHPGWHLDLAGFGGDEEQILAYTRDMPNVTWHGRVDYKRALELSRQADVLFATYDPSIPNHRYSSPNKIFEGMMLGKPLIVAENTNMDRIIREVNCGITVPYGDKIALENAFNMLEENCSLREMLGRNARQAYDETYSWKNMQLRLIGFYDQILQTKASMLQ